MKKAHRLLWQKLLIVSLLFFQFTLAFHSHDAEESVHCDACVTTHHADHEDHEEECWIGVFVQTNLAHDVFLPAPSLVYAALPKWRATPHETPLLSVYSLPLGSRAPPIL